MQCGAHEHLAQLGDDAVPGHGDVGPEQGSVKNAGGQHHHECSPNRDRAVVVRLIFRGEDSSHLVESAERRAEFVAVQPLDHQRGEQFPLRATISYSSAA